MDHPLCEHLDLYGAQFVVTQASYRRCLDAVDRLLSAGPVPELLRLADASLGEWSREDAKLREMLVEEVREGRVRIPSGLLSGTGSAARRGRREALRRGHPVCAECRRELPRLLYPEWSFAHNGAAAFRGEPFPPLPVAPA